MKVGELWRKRYDEALKEKQKLEERVNTLTYRLYATVGYALLLSILYIIKIK